MNSPSAWASGEKRGSCGEILRTRGTPSPPQKKIPPSGNFGRKSSRDQKRSQPKNHSARTRSLNIATPEGTETHANAQSFRERPTTTITHPSALHDNNSEPAYSGPTSLTMGGNGYLVPSANVNGASATAASTPGVDGHVDPSQIMDIGVMNGNIPAPLMAIDEDDEYFLTLTNVGMIMRPDLFEQHTVHFHGYPNASSFYDGVPDASVAINIGASFTYYYLAPDAGTYFWHCHITPPEHLQMGMVGQLYVRPRQNRVPAGTPLATATAWQQQDLRTACQGTGPAWAGG